MRKSSDASTLDGRKLQHERVKRSLRKNGCKVASRFTPLGSASVKIGFNQLHRPNSLETELKMPKKNLFLD